MVSAVRILITVEEAKTKFSHIVIIFNKNTDILNITLTLLKTQVII